MDTDEDGLIWITEPALRSGSIQDTEGGCVWLWHCLEQGGQGQQSAQRLGCSRVGRGGRRVLVTAIWQGSFKHQCFSV